MSIRKELPGLVGAGVISQETADRIEAYFMQQEQPAGNRLLAVFSILGAILMGLGILLVVAHNWDELSVFFKTVLAFVPLVAGQLLCMYSLLKKKNSAWTESSSAFLFLSVGAVISLVAQIYHIPGELDSFLYTWMLLCIPVVYVMNSSVAAIMYLVGITWYGIIAGYNDRAAPDYWYWAFLLLLFPYYYRLCRYTISGSFVLIMNWLLPVSLLVMLASFHQTAEELLILGYMNLLAVFYIAGSLPFFHEKKAIYNSYRALGSVGTIGILLALSFDAFWRDLSRDSFHLTEHLASPEFLVAIILFLAAFSLLITRQRPFRWSALKPADLVFVLFSIIYLIGCHSPAATVFINLLVLGIGIQTIRMGAKNDHLGVFNYGLLIILALASCRFFDERISFVLRGLLFISVGIGFFIANYIMLKRRKENE